MICDVCPRHCKIDREKNLGFCGMNEKLRLAKADVFMWEEPVISGTNGSGAIFFSGCNLKCCFCQNFEISHNKFGKEISVNRLVEIIKELESKNVHNINFVSPTHYSNQIMEALKIYKPKIPVVWNSNGYESVETIKKVAPFVDIFLVDLKFFDENLSYKYCKAKDYFEVATKVILEMVKQKPKVVMENGIMKSGVLIRHLVMPNCTADCDQVLKWIAENVKDKCMFSLMSQYTPCFHSKDFEEINRKISPLEYKYAISLLKKYKIENGFYQDLESSSECFIPIWDLKGL